MSDYATLHEAIIKGHGTERSFRCPVHDDSHASASVNVLKGLWFCYACGAKGKVDGYIPPQDDRDFQRDILNLLDNVSVTHSERWLDQFDAGPVHPYWRSRFTEEACRHFRLGYDYGKDQPCYPLRDAAGRVLGVVYRNLDGAGPKYRYPRGVAVRDLLFNYSPEHHDVVVLTEGAMDAVAIWEAGGVGLACYGAALSTAQMRLLQRIDPRLVIVAFDADRAGVAAADQAQGLLAEYGYRSVRPVWDALEYKDVAEMPITIRSQMLTELAP